MKPRNVSISVVESGDDLKIWCATFTLKGSLPRVDGRVDEKARKALQKKLAKFLETVEFPDEG